MLTKEELIKFGKFLDEGTNLLGEDYIVHKAEEYSSSQNNGKPSYVSGSLPLAQKLLNGIISADPNVIYDYERSDYVIRSLYDQCKILVQSLGGNDR